MKTFERVYKIVARIPEGKTMSYKQVAEFAGTTPIIVGFALHANKDPENVPCHRVIKIDGTLAKGYAFGGKIAQRKRLAKEGAIF